MVKNSLQCRSTQCTSAHYLHCYQLLFWTGIESVNWRWWFVYFDYVSIIKSSLRDAFDISSGLLITIVCNSATFYFNLYFIYFCNILFKKILCLWFFFFSSNFHPFPWKQILNSFILFLWFCVIPFHHLNMKFDFSTLKFCKKWGLYKYIDCDSTILFCKCLFKITHLIFC